MTIGVINELRGKGFANLLIEYLKDLTFVNFNIKYIYLHMVTYNNSGKKFYLKNSFRL